MKTRFLVVLSICALVVASCSKGEPDDIIPNNVQLAIDNIADKENTVSITINGELSEDDIELFQNIKTILPKLEEVTFQDITVLNSDVFGIGNEWIKKINAPKLVVIGNDALWNAETLNEVNFPVLVEAGSESFYSCTALEKINFPNLIIAGNDCFSSCENIKTLLLPKLETLSDYIFTQCLLIENIELPAVKTIGINPFLSCKNLNTIKFTTTEAIEVNKESFRDSQTATIDLYLNGVEFDNSVGNIWKDVAWKNITNATTGDAAKADFGIAKWGSTLEFVEKHETGTLLENRGVTYSRYGTGEWYTYIFDNADELRSGVKDFSFQFAGVNSEIITMPLRNYIGELDDLKEEFGDPYFISEDVSTFEDNTNFEPGSLNYECQMLMNGFKTFTYKFKNDRTDVCIVLSTYLRNDKYETWGYTIKTTYSEI